MADKIFVDGIRVFKPGSNAPEFVKADLTIKKKELTAFLETQPDEFRAVIKQSQKGGYYLEVNTYQRQEPVPADDEQPEPIDKDPKDDLPW